MPDDPQRRAATRARLLAAARKLFVASGVQRTSVSAIVQEARVAQGTFYLYFKSKDRLLAELQSEILRDYLVAFERATTPASTRDPRRRPGRRPEPRMRLADEALCHGVTAVYDAVAHHRRLLQAIRGANTGEETEAIWMRGRSRFAQPLGTLLQRGADQGSFRLDDASIAAHLALALLDDLLYEALVYESPADGPTMLAHGLRFLLRGLGTDPARIDELAPLPPPRRKRTTPKPRRDDHARH